MIDILISYLLNENEGVKIEKHWSYIDDVIATPMGIYGFKTIKDEIELKTHWLNCSYELSTKVQANLLEELDDFRWDIYLLFYVEEKVSTTARKLIENDRKFFRKIVLNNSDKDKQRIPFMFSNQKYLGIQEENFYLENSVFFEELKGKLESSKIQELGDDFFKLNNLSSDRLFLLLKEGILKNEN